MIKEISERIYRAAVVGLWLVVVPATSAVILASSGTAELVGEARSPF
jgi:hypothetical protein